jgi:hypothetical protein
MCFVCAANVIVSGSASSPTGQFTLGQPIEHVAPVAVRNPMRARERGQRDRVVVEGPAAMSPMSS